MLYYQSQKNDYICTKYSIRVEVERWKRLSKYHTECPISSR